MLLLVGQVARGTSGREGFQELDYRQVFGPVAKWATQVDDPGRLPEVLARAYWVACSGRPGPVVVALPEDMLTERTDVADAVRAPVRVGRARRGRARAAARAPRRPRSGRWRSSARAAGRRRPARTSWPSPAPPACRWPRPSAARTTSTTTPRSTPGTRGSRWPRRWRGASPRPTSCWRSAAASGTSRRTGGRCSTSRAPRQRLVHVHPDPDELGAVYQPELPIVSGLPAFAAAARALAPPAGAERRRALVAQARAEYEANLREHRELPGALQVAEVMAVLRDRLDADAILTCGAGNFTVWAHRFYAFRRFPSQLAPRSGSMGYGVPGGGGGEGRRPERTVVCLAGDGDFLMTGQELATAVQEELAVVVLVVNNGMYGTIRMHQERHYPGRVVGTDLVNPDFAAYARAFGAHGAVVERTEDFAARARRGARPPADPPCSSCASTPRRSRRARRWPRSGRRRDEPHRAARPRAARALQPLHRRGRAPATCCSSRASCPSTRRAPRRRRRRGRAGRAGLRAPRARPGGGRRARRPTSSR